MGKVLEVKNLTKIYEGGVLANHNINFSVEEGEIHALVGENGAGKSTLMKMLYGMESVTSGEIYVRGKAVKFSSSKDAIAHGIGMVHQHFMLIESISGAENMMMGLKNRPFFTRKKSDIDEMNKVAQKYNFDIEADRLVRDMSVGMKQKLEILKILYRGDKIIILDEPTAVLTPQETKELFERLKELKKHGMTIIFISHKLNEVKQISDRITVLKSGETKGTFNTSDVSEDDISRHMVGQVISFDYKKDKPSASKEIMSVEGIKFKDIFNVLKVNDVSFKVFDGEIVGIAGVDGNGQSELIQTITGEKKPHHGKIIFNGKDITNMPIKGRRNVGMAYVPEDRMENGCAPNMSVKENIMSLDIDNFSGKMGILDNNKITAHCKKLISEYMVKTPSENQTIKSLSGGNIQKAIVAREFSEDGNLLILDQPTRGVDIGAISFIHSKILDMRKSKKAIILVSADLTELISLSDRIIVMSSGRMVAELDNYSKKVKEDELGAYMLGLKVQEHLKDKNYEGERYEKEI